MFSWVQLASMNHGASLPHELIAATQELSKKPKREEPLKKADGAGGKGGGRGDSKTKSSWKCHSWNISETRGKCRWEVENAPEKCKALHECSWCKAKSFTPVDHQRSFCRKRLEEEGG